MTNEQRMAWMADVLSEIVAEWDHQHKHETHQTGFTKDSFGIAMAREVLADMQEANNGIR